MNKEPESMPNEAVAETKEPAPITPVQIVNLLIQKYNFTNVERVPGDRACVLVLDSGRVIAQLGAPK